jgi:hypothetical protein
MKWVSKLLLLAVFCSANVIYAQKSKENLKFGQIKPSDFDPTFYSVDSSAGAVYLFNNGKSSYVDNNDGFFSVVYEQHTRIRFMNKNGFGVATVNIPVYISDDYQTKLISLEASTFNLENGQVVETKLVKSALYTEGNHDETIYKFTFPNVKEGSIAEFQIKLNLPSYYFMPDWDFKQSYPVLYSSYEVNVPYFFNYAIIKKGIQDYVLDTATDVREQYYIRDKRNGATLGGNTLAVSTQATKHIWAMKNVPAFHAQPIMTRADNYVSGIEFQLSEIRMPEEDVKKVAQSWNKVSEQLLNNPYFGLELKYDNTWLKDDIQTATANATNNLEKVQGIFAFVRNNYNCIDHSSRLLSQPLKKVLQTRKGNVADINMVLTAMLKQVGLEAYPVILSTRHHEKVLRDYPVMHKFNYVITRVVVDDVNYYLDASRKYVGFNQLPEYCYNGFAREINDKDPILLRFDADSLKEYEMDMVQLKPDLANHTLNLSVNKTFCNIESQNARGIIMSTSLDAYMKAMQNQYNIPVRLTDVHADNLKELDDPLKLQFTAALNLNDDKDIIYLNPMLSDRILENPFTSQQRIYPIEMPYCPNQTYIFEMEVPDGYMVDELPKSARVQLNANEGSFEYIIVNKNNHIQMRCRLLMNKANFSPEDYATLRDFYAFIVQKESEHIVLKKNKTLPKP